MGYILVGSLTRLKTLVYKINGAEYIKVYMKHNGELNPGIVPYMHCVHCPHELHNISFTDHNVALSKIF